MKTALISAKGAERFYAGKLFDEIENLLHRELIFLMEDMEWMPNLGLLTLAGVMDPSYEIVYIDEEYLDSDTVNHLVYKEDFDLACLSVINAQYRRSYEIADILRNRGIPVAMGGVHPTALPWEAAEHADYIFIGEAEDTFKEFLDDFKKGIAKPFYKPQKAVSLSELPPPRFDLLNQFNYLEKFNRFPIQATRGCPRVCDFCFLPRLYGSKHRHKTVDQVVKEIETIKSMTEQPFISFTDENMFIDSAYAEELVKRLIPLKVMWECYCDIDTANNDKLLDLLRQSHCTLLLIGLETVNPMNLKGSNPWKHSRINKYKEAVKKIQSQGIGTAGLFIVGFDYDTPAVFDEIRQFADETDLLDIEVSALCPFPGTDLYNKLEAQGRILNKNWEKYTWIHMNFQPMRISPVEIIEGLFRLFKDMVKLKRLIKQQKYFRSLAKSVYDSAPTREGKPTFLAG